MNAERIAEIRQRCEAATAGPWWIGTRKDSLSMLGRVLAKYDGESCVLADFNNYFKEIADNKSFCCHARTDIPDLLAAVESLHAENARLRAALGAAKDALREFNSYAPEYDMSTDLAAIDAALEESR